MLRPDVRQATPSSRTSTACMKQPRRGVASRAPEEGALDPEAGSTITPKTVTPKRGEPGTPKRGEPGTPKRGEPGPRRGGTPKR